MVATASAFLTVGLFAITSSVTQRSIEFPLRSASYLGHHRKGSIAKGKQADLVVCGNPAQKIEDIENVEIVFKEGTGYDPAKLIQSIQGQVGIR